MNQAKKSRRFSFLCHEYPPFGGGASSALAQFLKILVSRGHDIQVITVGPRNWTDEIRSEDNLQIVRLGGGRRSVFSPTAFEIIRAYWALRYRSKRHIRAFSPDVLVSYFAFPAGYAALALKQKLDLPLAVSLRGSDVPGFSRERWGAFGAIQPILVRRVIEGADLVCANGGYLTELAEPYAAGRPIHNLPNGVDTAAFFPAMPRQASRALRLIFVGQLIRRKGCIELLEGLENIAKKGRDIELTVVGEGPLRQEMETRTEGLLPAVTVKFSGYVPRNQMPDLYRRHDALVNLSYAEGVSNVLLEALASGLALIVTRNASRDIIGENDAAVILDSLTPEKIKSAIWRLIDNPDQLRAMQEKAGETARRFDWQETALEFEDLVRELSEP